MHNSWVPIWNPFIYAICCKLTFTLFSPLFFLLNDIIIPCMWLDVQCLQSSSAIFPKKSVIFQPYNGSTPNHTIPFCYFLFLWAFTCVLWMLEVNQVFSNLGVIQSEINVNPQSTLPELVPRLMMLSSPWVSDAKFGVSNWSAAEMRQKSASLKFVCWF